MKLAIITYTTDPFYPQMRFFTESLRWWGWPEPHAISLACGYQGHPHKLACVKAELPKLLEQGYTHALYSDCWDVICTGPFKNAERWCENNPKCTLLSADIALWPAEDIAESHFHFRPGDSPFRFVNGGGWLGDIKHLLSTVLEGSEQETVNDQWHLTRKWMQRRPGIKLDSECEIFQCLSQVDPKWFDIFESKRCDGKLRIYNCETGTMPLLIHGAGGADMSWVPTPPSTGPWTPFDRFAVHPANSALQSQIAR